MVATHQFTVDDLASFPDDGNRYEVIEGEIYVTAAPHFDHQLAVDAIVTALRMWDPDARHGVTVSGAGLIFSRLSGVIPDLVWVRADHYRAVLVHPDTGRRDGKLHAAPSLVVEVVSPGRENSGRTARSSSRSTRATACGSIGSRTRPPARSRSGGVARRRGWNWRPRCWRMTR